MRFSSEQAWLTLFKNSMENMYPSAKDDRFNYWCTPG
jgi:hypothetical protein